MNSDSVRTRWPLAVSVVIAVAVVGTACGSRLPRAELEAAQGPFSMAVAAREASPTERTDSGLSQPAVMVGDDDTGVASSAPLAPGAPDDRSKTSGPAQAATDRSSMPVPRDAGGPSASVPSPAAGASQTPPRPGASPAGPAAAKAEIRLASLGVGSGPLGAVMQPIPDAVRAWVASVNDRGGLAGHRVRLLVGDDGGDPARALTLARQFVEQEQVHAFLGTHMVTTEQAITDYVDQKRVPIIGTCNCSAGNDGSPMVFFFGPSATKGLAWSHLAPLATLAQAKTVAFLYCREAPQCSAAAREARTYAPQAGMQVVYEAQVSLAQPDYTAEAISAQNAGAEAVAVFADNQTAMRFIRSAHRQGWQPAVSTQQSGYDERMLKVGESEGLYTSAIVPDLFTDPRLAAYRQAMERIPGGVRATIGASTFVVGQLLEKLAPAFPDDPRSEDFVTALEGLRAETMGGLFPPITFRPGAAHEETNRCVIPAVIHSGKFETPAGDGFVCAPGWTPVQL